MGTPITGLYAALAAILIIVLSVLVVRGRRAFQVGLGAGGHRALERLIRAHANSTEYLPLALILMLIYELGGGSAWMLHFLGVTLILARIAHGWGISRSGGASWGRVIGTGTTWMVIVLLALLDALTFLRG